MFGFVLIIASVAGSIWLGVYAADILLESREKARREVIAKWTPESEASPPVFSTMREPSTPTAAESESKPEGEAVSHATPSKPDVEVTSAAATVKPKLEQDVEVLQPPPALKPKPLLPSPTVSPPPTPPAASPAPLPAVKVESLLKRARQLIAHGDVVAARLFLEAELTGDGHVLFLLAQTYDP